MDVIHGFEHGDVASIRPVAGADAEILMEEDTFAGRQDIDIRIGGDAVALLQVSDIDTVLREQLACPPAGRIRADGAEIERGLAQPRKLDGDIHRISPDKRLGNGRAKTVDAIVADGGEADALHADLFRDGKAANTDRRIRGSQAFMSSRRISRRRACNSGGSSADGCA